MKIVSWNVNGIVACRRKGLLKFLSDAKPDIVCIQEIKTQCPLNTPEYFQFWNPAERKGYAGTFVLTKRQPLSVQNGMGIKKFDIEGRLITLEFPEYFIINVYAPSLNPHSAPDRPGYRLDWDKALKSHTANLPKPVILAGDFNFLRIYNDCLL